MKMHQLWSCKAKLYAIDIGHIFSRETGTHSYKTNIVVRPTISNNLKRSGLDYLTDRPSEIIKHEIANNLFEATSTLTRKDV